MCAQPCVGEKTFFFLAGCFSLPKKKHFVFCWVHHIRTSLFYHTPTNFNGFIHPVGNFAHDVWEEGGGGVLKTKHGFEHTANNLVQYWANCSISVQDRARYRLMSQLLQQRFVFFMPGAFVSGSIYTGRFWWFCFFVTVFLIFFFIFRSGRILIPQYCANETFAEIF